MPSKCSMYCGRVATVAIARACSATLPSPPHCATSLPPGRSTEWIRENSLSWSSDPVEGRRGEQGVHGPGCAVLLQQVGGQLEQVGDDQRHPVVARELLTGDLDHLGGAVHADHAPIRESFQELLGDAAGAAAGVDDRLIRMRVETIQHLEAPLVLGLGDLIVGLGVPLAGTTVIERGHSPVRSSPGRHRLCRPFRTGRSSRRAQGVIAMSSRPLIRLCRSPRRSRTGIPTGAFTTFRRGRSRLAGRADRDHVPRQDRRAPSRSSSCCCRRCRRTSAR